MHKYGRVWVWGSDLEEATLAQAQKATTLAFVPNHVALMADAHVGIGATIGSVIPTVGAVIPAAVGVDIGCGMIAVETDIGSDRLPHNLSGLLARIEAVVPAGLGRGHDSERSLRGLSLPSHFTPKEATTTARQFGTLGSGNHFVEVCLDEREVVWVVLHSGSRGIGNQLARKHISRARALMSGQGIRLADQDLAYLVEGTPEFDDYIRDMVWAQSYALANREAMMDAILPELYRVVDARMHHEVQRINCHHNYCQRERHFGQDVWLTRKGAIRAGLGDLGVIPGSMGTRSYIVRGLGNPASYHSCSHGAGRRLSRSAARKSLSVDSLTRRMAGKAWNATHARALLDEHPLAYKEIDQVMADQADLVEPVHTLSQILNYKGIS